MARNPVGSHHRHSRSRSERTIKTGIPRLRRPAPPLLPPPYLPTCLPSCLPLYLPLSGELASLQLRRMDSRIAALTSGSRTRWPGRPTDQPTGRAHYFIVASAEASLRSSRSHSVSKQNEQTSHRSRQCNLCFPSTHWWPSTSLCREPTDTHLPRDDEEQTLARWKLNSARRDA